MALGARKTAITGVLSAVIIVLGITRLGFIPLPMGAVTIMHVPVIIGAVLEGPVVGLIIGFLFGLFSLIQAAIAAANPLDAAFVNPLISILPRLFIGPAAWFLYTLITNGAAIRGLKREIPALVAAAFGGTVVNTLLVLSALGVFRFLPWPVIFTIALTNSPAEAAAAIIVTLAVILAWKRIPPGKSRLSREKTAE
jgi:uncharacterized membrane protein